jgi:hypothetical protein
MLEMGYNDKKRRAKERKEIGGEGRGGEKEERGRGHS